MPQFTVEPYTSSAAKRAIRKAATAGLRRVSAGETEGWRRVRGRTLSDIDRQIHEATTTMKYVIQGEVIEYPTLNCIPHLHVGQCIQVYIKRRARWREYISTDEGLFRRWVSLRKPRTRIHTNS